MTDYNPITTPNTILTDALNATYITYNGNETILQNDMGNTLIQDKTTGNIMSLSPGFVPVGMKEHGGILYIASYNKETGEGELGTIPSPLFNYTYDETPEVTELSSGNDSIVNIALTPGNTIELTDLQPANKIQISNYSFHVGELFMIGLNTDDKKIRRRLYIKNSGLLYTNFPLLDAYSTDNSGGTVKSYGLYKLLLYAGIKSSNLGLFPMTAVTESVLTYYTLGAPDTVLYANGWYLSESNLKDLDVSVCSSYATAKQNTYRTYPNIPNGNLFIQASLNENTDYSFVKNESTGINSPFYEIIVVPEE